MNVLSPPIMKEVFQINNHPYNLTNRRILASKHKSTMAYGITAIGFKGP